MIRALLVAGTRPNFIKIAPLHRSFDQHAEIDPILVHTGQHYDAALSDVFFRQLELPEPDISLSTGSGTHANQTARVMQELEPVIAEQKPDVVVVVGDVNSTLAAALTASKLHVPVAHVEAGLRSFDRRMPEEINRIATDAISDHLFVTEAAGVEHLRREGKPDGSVFFTGNVMIDSLRRYEERARSVRQHEIYGVAAGSFILVTAHRPELVDDPHLLAVFVESIRRIGERHPVLFPIHPRTRQKIDQSGLGDALIRSTGVRIVDPLGYFEFLSLILDSGLVLTDSGGIQEETTALGIPCATIRDNTERPCTIEVGTNELLNLDPDALEDASDRAVAGRWKTGSLPELWDGHAAERVAGVLASVVSG